MKTFQVQFAPWDKVYSFKNPSDLNISAGDYVIVETEIGKELGKLISISQRENKEEELKPILRKAGYDDVNRLASDKKKQEALELCQKAIDRLNLDMKLIDVHFSFEGKKINFAFISENRVDFRELVKQLASHFNANIRLTQIGTRDEAKATGDCGPCGRGLCCKQFLCEFSSITSEMAEAQQVVHRGSDRISGMCGRLMCCLAYEYDGYKEMGGKLPPVGTKMKINGEKAVVISKNLLKQTVNVKIYAKNREDRDTIIEFNPLLQKNRKA